MDFVFKIFDYVYFVSKWIFVVEIMFIMIIVFCKLNMNEKFFCNEVILYLVTINVFFFY